MRLERDGLAVWFGTADAPAQVEAAAGTGLVLVSVTVRLLSERGLRAELVGVLRQADGTAAPLLQVGFNASVVGGTGPKVTAVTGDSGCLHPLLPQGAKLVPEGGVPLTLHGTSGNAAATVPAAQVAANGLVGTLTLPIALAPLRVSILTALTALQPVAPAAQGVGGRQLPVVKLGDGDACRVSFGAGNTVDTFPHGAFFRLVEPGTSVPAVACSIRAGQGFVPVPSYVAGSGPDGTGSAVDRVPVEQLLAVDGFRDQVAELTAAGVVTAKQTVPMAGSLGLGYALWMSERWTCQHLGLGNLVYSLPLAPGEQQQMAIYERVDTAASRECEFFTEEGTEAQALRADTSTQATFNSAFDETVNAGSSFTTTTTTTATRTSSSRYRASPGCSQPGAGGSARRPAGTPRQAPNLPPRAWQPAGCCLAGRRRCLHDRPEQGTRL